ncbi:GNAT family N-acetyltransferase [Streptomyces sp. NPDC054904]|uniref:GNAT family N-acetyltransferase n=1 Tax=unclassified Streptomyces TaxID=2593676 RepID=UPI002481FDCD|nr:MULTISPECIES: GNAT family N-acetyltransferase [unclassified Streptomyces]MDA5283635.1 GNAT family N-acetyltransferase [Streptomyces sp. Isolate_45]MDX2390553.1 GNAT family N-acetyltransferase [Streptomyces sp. DK15]
MRIRAAVLADLPVCQDIERAAGECFRDIGMPAVADDDPLPLEELARYAGTGLAWVATGPDDRPLAYLIAEPVDGALHVEQVSVHPAGARRGVGRALLEHAALRAAARRDGALTLTTFAAVPWNAPYYLRCGFRILADEELTPGLREIRRQEALHGLDRWPRVCMGRAL